MFCELEHYRYGPLGDKQRCQLNFRLRHHKPGKNALYLLVGLGFYLSWQLFLILGRRMRSCVPEWQSWRPAWARPRWPTWSPAACRIRSSRHSPPSSCPTLTSISSPSTDEGLVTRLCVFANSNLFVYHSGKLTKNIYFQKWIKWRSLANNREEEGGRTRRRCGNINRWAHCTIDTT